MKNLCLTLLVVLGVFLSTLAAGAASRLAPFRLIQNSSTTMTAKQDTFSVSGETTIETIPDEAQVSLGISTTSPTVSAAQSTINTTINSITASITALGINQEDIKTSDYFIYPNYDYSSAARSITGYSAAATIRVTTSNFDLLNQVIDTASANGANNISNVSFNLSTAKEKEVLKQARAQAIAAAKSNAQELAQLSGMTLGNIINVIETNNSPAYRPVISGGAMKDVALAQEAGTDVQSGTTNYIYSVSLEFDVLQ